MAAHRLALAALVLLASAPWLQLAAIARAAALRLATLALVLIAGCCAPPPSPLFPPGPTLAAQVLDHGQVAIAAARWRDSLEASQSVKLTGNEAVDQSLLVEAQHGVDARWAPVAEAMRTLRTAVDAYRAAVDRGEHPADAEVLAALCGLRAAMPARWQGLVPAAEGCR